MVSKTTISVITAALNAVETIKDCLESVKKQNYPVQHVIIDGLSHDGTQELSKKHACPGATIISERDGGPYDAINKGIGFATGNVVGVLNADDFYPHSRVLYIVAKVFENPEVGACYGDLVYVDRKSPSRIARYWKSRPFDERLFYNGWMPPHPTFFVRRTVYKDLGIFNLDQGSAADYELMLRFLLKYRTRVCYIPTVLAVMRKGGLSNRSFRQRVRANRLDKRAWIVNGLKPMPWTLLAKPVRKIFQFLSQGPRSRPWLDHEWTSGGEARTQAEEKSPPACPLKASHNSSKTGKDISFYVVTVNYRDDYALTRLIESLEPIHFLKKLIIVNHANSAPIRCRIPLQIVFQENIGYGGGLNRGLRQIRETDAIALLCNPDTVILDPDELLTAIKYLSEKPEIGCLVPRLVDENSQPVPSWRSFYTIGSLATARSDSLKRWHADFPPKHFSEHETSEQSTVDWGSGSALLFKTSLFPYPVSFDERFFLYFEDVDFCAQIWKAGLSVESYRRLIFRHTGKMASHKSAYFFALHLSSLVKFILKYRGLPQRQHLTNGACSVVSHPED